MYTYFAKRPLWEVSESLSATAQGRQPADLVIKNARLVNVCTHEIQENTAVAIKHGRIALVGNADHCIGENTKVIDANGQYIAPGFLDGHVHVESSMLTVGEYAKAVVPHGTVGIYMDPHEICNVLGKDGVRLMAEDAKRTPLKTMITVPSCVPAVPGFEDTGASIDSQDIKEMMTWQDVVGLGEMMNFPGVVNSMPETHAILAETLKANKVITGHYSIPETESGLNAYAAAGICCCHESTRREDALAKMRLGMYAMLREGSAWRDLSEVAKAVTENEIDSRFAVLVSDDTHPHTLTAEGHLDHILKRAVEEGIDPISAIQMVTINCATCFRMEHELGSITPGKCAHIVFIKDLSSMEVTKVVIDGQLTAENGKMLYEFKPFTYPEWATKTMNVGHEITADSFKIQAPQNGSEHEVRVIEIIPEKVSNYQRIVKMKSENGQIKSDLENDILKVFVFERHKKTGTVGYGFVKGFGIEKGALAQTVAHDAHNLLVVGTNDEDMALAVNTLIKCGGGMCAVCDGKVLGLVELPVAGLMNEKSAQDVAADVEKLGTAWKNIGCKIESPFMTMALIPLACLPELRLTNRGLVNCQTFEFADLFVK